MNEGGADERKKENALRTTKAIQKKVKGEMETKGAQKEREKMNFREQT